MGENARLRIRSSIVVLFLVLSSSYSGAETIHESETIDTNTVWTAAGNDHIVIGYVWVSAGVSLTIEDGCTVRFDQGAYMSVYGSLNASGSSGILFTCRDSVHEWRGLWFYGGSDGTLKHCTIEYASHSSGYGIHTNGAFPEVENCVIRDNRIGVYATNTASPSLSAPNVIQDNSLVGVKFINCTDPVVSHQTITGHSGTYGAIHVYQSGEFTLGEGNDITGNAWGVTMDISSYPSAASYGNIPTTGNENDDGMQVYGGSTNENIFWRDVGADYIVTSAPTLSAGDTLTVEDGATLRFEQGMYIYVYGILNAEGTEGGGIRFTRRDSTDAWRGLFYYGSSGGTLEHCTIEHATHSNGYAIYASDTDSLRLSSCTLRNNFYGFRGIGGSPEFIANNTITGNSYGVYLTDGCIPVFGDTLPEWNDIHENIVYDFVNDQVDSVLAPYVYWGNIIEVILQMGIYDHRDDSSLGLVMYEPWTNIEHDTLFYSYTPGDANGDGVIDCLDVEYLVEYLFFSGPAPDPLEDGDANSSGDVTPADISFIVKHFIHQGPEGSNR
jgi:hypothetical protein